MTAPDDPSPAPDVTGSVMARLGYERAGTRPAVGRRRALAVRAMQAALVLGACALGIAWWGARARADRSQPAVGDAMRGSVVQGAGRLDALRLGMPRRAQATPIIASEAGRPTGAATRVTEPAASTTRTY
jgi:hypothetical protein